MMEFYRASNMVLVAHSNTGVNNESRLRSKAGTTIFLPDNDSLPRWNGPLLTIAKIITYVVSFAAEAETTAPV